MVESAVPYNPYKKAAREPREATEGQEKYSWLNMEERRTQLQYRPDGLLVHNLAGRKEGRTETEKAAYKEKLKQELSTARISRFKGELSISAEKNLIRAFDNLMMISRQKLQYNQYLKKSVPFRLNMITLTIPTGKPLSSKEMNKRILDPFLRRLNNYCQRQYRKKLVYLWKLELQQRGQLHWHIVTNKWIPWEFSAMCWNEVLKDSGLSREYFEKHGSHNVRPATKTEAVRRGTAKELRSYVLKRYLKKKIQKNDLSHFQNKLPGLDNVGSVIDGSAWGCSDVLKEKYLSFELDFSTYLRIKQYCKDNAADGGRVLNFDFCMILKDEQGQPPDKLLSVRHHAQLRSHIDYLQAGGQSFLDNLN